MRNAPSILLAVALAVPAFAEQFDVLFDQPQLDRWMYPFNSSAGARATMSVFGSDREVPTQFDARDGQILLAFDTDLAIPPGGTAAGYRVTGAEVTLQVQNTQVFRYDPTPDAWTTFLPATDFSTRQPYPDARRVIDAGATVALATNCNPGSSYTTSMSFCIALAVRDMHMTPDEAIAAATVGGAAALRRTDVGRIAAGMRADLCMLDAPSYTHLVYRPGVPLVHTVIEGGVVA